MSYLIGAYSNYDESTTGYDSNFPNSNFQVNLNTVSFGHVSATDSTDWFELNLNGSGHYTLFVSTDATNNYSAQHQWDASKAGIIIEIVDRNGLPLKNIDTAIANLSGDGAISFDYNGGASYGEFFVKVSNLSYANSDYVLSLSNGALPGFEIQGTTGHDYLVGSNGNDNIYAGAGRDLIFSSAGDDYISGGSGLDTLVLGGKVSDYSMQGSRSQFNLTDHVGHDGVDTISQVERLVFSDGAIALDIDGNAGQAYRLYDAALGRKPDLVGLGYWIDQLDAGASLTEIAETFVHSSEFQNLYGSHPSVAALVTELYQNILYRLPDQGGFDYWSNQLRYGKMSVAEVVVAFSESVEHQAQIIGQIQNGIDYLVWQN